MRTKVAKVKIIEMLKEHQAGESVQTLCANYGVSNSTFYRWKQHYEITEKDEAMVDKASSEGLPDIDFRKLLGCG